MRERERCLICGSNNLETFHRIEKMPVFMGTIPKEINYDFSKMCYDECLGCGNVQIKNIPSIESVYLCNHNIDTVGELWNNHFDEFRDFIGNVTDKNILEISDPSAKIAKRCKNFNKWTIVELNPSFQETAKIKVLKTFFSEETKIDFDVDLIIHSHFFEHSLDPNSHLRKMFTILKDGGEMFFSIPDLESLIKDSKSPTALNFEHGYFYDDEIIKILLDKNGFDIVKTNKFRNHSIFYHVRKTNKKNVSVKFNSRKNLFIDCFNFHTNNIKSINETCVGSKNVFIYGSHVTSQFYIFNNLNVNLIGILDRSSSKNEQILYGTKLKTFFVEEFLKYDECIIIVSHSSIYKNEIVENVNLINDKTKIIII